MTEQPETSSVEPRRGIPRIVRAAGGAVSLLLLALVLSRAVRDTGDLHISPLPAVGAAILFGLSWLALGVGWSLLAADTARVGDMATWSRTQLFRYLPGGVWAPASRFRGDAG